MFAAVMTGDAPECASFPDPEPCDGAVVVDVLAAALTRFDVMVATGRHYFAAPPKPFVLGREGVARLEDGRRVYFGVHSTLPPFGSMAQRTLVDPQYTMEVPDGVSDALAAALGNAGLAAWLPLSWRAGMKAGERVLVLGATGTSGAIAVAAAKLLGADHIVAAGRDSERLEQARALGADAIVNLAEGGDLSRRYLDAAGGPVDVVLDYLCGAPAESAIGALAEGGRMVLIGTTVSPTLGVAGGTLRRASADIMGFAYYHAPMPEQRAAYRALAQHAAEGRIVMDIEPVDLADVGAAWTRMAQGSRRRQVVLP
jgi:NADPH2:quinone reductase